MFQKPSRNAVIVASICFAIAGGLWIAKNQIDNADDQAADCNAPMVLSTHSQLTVNQYDQLIRVQSTGTPLELQFSENGLQSNKEGNVRHCYRIVTLPNGKQVKSEYETYPLEDGRVYVQLK